MKKTHIYAVSVTGVIALILAVICIFYNAFFTKYDLYITNLPAYKGIVIDNILVKKSQRKMFLRQAEKIVKEYKISLGGNPKGAKIKKGDQKTPEGTYYIASHNPKSSYHLSLKISYPNKQQVKQAKENGYDAGGDIMIHGLPNKIPNFIFNKIHQNYDWTAGCIAVNDEEISEIYTLVKDGTKIIIEP